MVNIELDALEHIKGANGKIYEKYPVTKAKNVQGLDDKIKETTATPSTATPLMDGTATPGADNGKYAREGHVHPTDTSRAPTDHKSTATTYGRADASNYGHAMASSANPAANGTANPGTDNGKFAREGHVHPTDTSRAPTNHATSAETYGIATDSNYGHVRVTGDAGASKKYVRLACDYRDGVQTSLFNGWNFYHGDYKIIFKGNADRAPSGLDANTNYEAILKVENVQGTGIGNYTTHSTLYIPSLGRRWERWGTGYFFETTPIEGRLRLQRGSQSCGANATTRIYFPTTFNNEPLVNGFVSPWSSNTPQHHIVWVSNNYFEIYNRNSSAITFNWVAIGV